MAVSFSMSNPDLKATRDSLGKFVKAIEDKPWQIMLEEAARANVEAQLLVPEKTGTLARQTHIKAVRNRNVSFSLVGEASAIDHGFDYGQYRHEHEAKTYTKPGSHYKFVETPFNKAVERIERRLETEIKHD